MNNKKKLLVVQRSKPDPLSREPGLRRDVERLNTVSHNLVRGPFLDPSCTMCVILSCAACFTCAACRVARCWFLAGTIQTCVAAQCALSCLCTSLP
jgi:hypothetical protein